MKLKDYLRIILVLVLCIPFLGIIYHYLYPYKEELKDILYIFSLIGFGILIGYMAFSPRREKTNKDKEAEAEARAHEILKKEINPRHAFIYLFGFVFFVSLIVVLVNLILKKP